MIYRTEKAYKTATSAKFQWKENHKLYTETMEKVRLWFPFKYQSKLIIMDYYQNIYNSNFGGEQPVYTYYLSSRNVN